MPCSGNLVIYRAYPNEKKKYLQQFFPLKKPVMISIKVENYKSLLSKVIKYKSSQLIHVFS